MRDIAATDDERDYVIYAVVEWRIKFPSGSRELDVEALSNFLAFHESFPEL